ISEQEIIAICKALAIESRILLIDEASAPLDGADRQVLYNILKNLRDKGCGIVYISHHLEEIFKIGDRVTVMRDGKNISTVDVSETDRKALIDSMVGNKKIYALQKKAFDYDTVCAEKETPILEFVNVENEFLKSINFKIHKGEIVGFAGLAGANRSKIAEAMFGLCPIRSGNIMYKGKMFDVKHSLASIRLGCGLVPEDRKQAGLLGCRSVAENIVITNINKFNKKFISLKWKSKTAQQYIKKINIKTSGVNQQVEYLSGGNQQKVVLAKWLNADSELLFLIEPTAGIDVGARMEIYKIIQELSTKGISIVIITSDIDELMTLTNRIFTMISGQIINMYMTSNAEKRLILSDILSQKSV
ncbi:MAG: sugar ABC transporter ATP-binding protein, partial [Bacteroidales bacterium]|nr:sugar ABC transporter ATP-binding protein [Bacteroidales bacterium]